MLAYLPSPARAVWHLGPLPVRAYALCLAAGIVLGVWVASRRYTRAGGQPGVILDIAAWAVPCGLVGGRLYIVATDYGRYFGSGHDLLGIAAVSDGTLGFPGALAAGSAGAWFACRRAGIALAPVAGAAAPGLAFGLALGSWGNWFGQQLYGWPSSLPWAVVIAPAHRVPGYENYATFQPAFGYECGWYVLTGLLVIWAARRFALTGDRAFAVWLAAFAVGRYGAESLTVGSAHHLFGLRINQWVMALVFAGAVGYLYLTRSWQPARPAAAAAGPVGPAGPASPVGPGRPAAAPGPAGGPRRLASGPQAGVVPPAGTPAGPGRPGGPPVLPHLGRFGTRA
ncbi:MAG TPA: prolipoprotein diacylglyceryl transferase family protein [Streptosporangiaceae bacterium]|nr:prolipoprotein diacylglyceryl transferase family protein [Streptosporangiaceae bacterium]